MTRLKLPSPLISLAMVTVMVTASLNLGAAYSTYISKAIATSAGAQAGDWGAPQVSFDLGGVVRTNKPVTITYQVNDLVTPIDKLDLFVRSASPSAGAWKSVVQVTGINKKNTNGQFELPVSDLSDATYDVALLATDKKGNVAPFPEQGPHQLTIDTTAPAQPADLEPTTNSMVNAEGEFSWTASPITSLSETITYTLLVDQTATAAATITTEDTVVAVAELGLPDGQYTWQVKACDDLANCAAETTKRSVVLDTTAPLSTATLANQLNFSGTNDVPNGNFESGLTSWRTQGAASTTAHGGTQPAGSALQLQPSISTIALAGTDIASASASHNQVGFWYKFANITSTAEASSLMVFADETLVFERWSDAVGSNAWQYVQVDTSARPFTSITFASSTEASSPVPVLIDEVTTQAAQVVDNPIIKVVAEDTNSPVTAFARYTQNGQEVTKSGSSPLTVALTSFPDDNQISYWAVDAAGNQETAKTLTVAPFQVQTAVLPTVEEEEELAASPSPTPQVGGVPSEASDSADLNAPAASMSITDNKVGLTLTNLTGFIKADFLLTYLHSLEDDQSVQEAITGTADITSDELTIDNWYLGTCSSTAGVVCVPHLNVTETKVEVTLFDANQNEVTITAQP